MQIAHPPLTVQDIDGVVWSDHLCFLREARHERLLAELRTGRPHRVIDGRGYDVTHRGEPIQQCG